jgi:type I restriction enzyme, S subunit
MSHIDDLMERLCPNGVEFKPLGEMAEIGTGSSDRKYATLDGAFPFYVRSKDVLRMPQYEFDEEAVLIPGEGGIGDIFHYVSGKYALHQRAYRVRLRDPSVLTKFLFRIFENDFKAFIASRAVSATVTSIRKPMIADFRIPVPPLEVQREIVRILDLFQSLEAELEAELEARRRQYAHYRNSLLTFADSSRERVRWLTLADVAKSVGSGGTPLSTRRDFYDGGDIPWLRTQEVVFADIVDTEVRITDAGLRNSSAKWIPADCVIVAISGATAARVGVNKIPLTTNQHCCNVELDPSAADYRYVFHWMTAHYESLKQLGQGARGDLNVGIISRFPIALPPIDEQQRIARTLDKFDALVNDLSSGLPAELAARRKQYEYYRNKLLTFEEAV